MAETLADRPLPPVPPDLDLSGFPWLPLDTAILNSDLFERAPDAAFRAAVGIWCLSWKMVPASSLPNDEKRIAALIGLSPQKWRTVREWALAGFVLCADGRLYHSLIAEQAQEAGKRRETQRARSRSYWDRKKAGGQASLLGDNLLETRSGGSTTQSMSGPAPGPFVLPSWVDPETWTAFEEHRKLKRAPMTPRARYLICKELEKIDPTHATANQLLDQSMRKGWLDVFPLKDSGPAGAQHVGDDVVHRFAGKGSR